MSDPLLPGSEAPLLEVHDRLLLDLDGVCYVGDAPIPAAVTAMRAVRDAGVGVRFLTNNASRTPAEVAARLVGYGIDAADAEIITSAGCAASVLADELPSGAPILVVGGPGLIAALEDAGLKPVPAADDDPVAVVQGWHPDVGWRLLAEAAVAIRRGAQWVATNLDTTIPSERGRLPGNGALVAALGTAVDVSPRVIGKPEPVMYDAAGGDARASLAVGDRLDTDIEGARRAGVPSLLVMTGVTVPADLLRAPSERRPTHIGADLSAVCDAMPAVAAVGSRFVCRDAAADFSGDRPEVSGDAGPDGLDRLRAACAAAWAAQQLGQEVGDVLQNLDLNLNL